MKLVVLLLVAAAVAFNDAHLAEDVEAATSRVNVFVNQVRKRAQQYRLRAQKWLKFQEQQQNKFFESEIDRVGDRVGRFLNEEHTDDEQSAFQMAERARVAKAKQDVQQGMHDAGLDVLQGTETAEKDLEAGLNEATADLYRGIEEAKHERAGDVNAVKADLMRRIRRATVDIFRGVRKSRHDYRQGLYKARRDLRTADESAHKDLELD